MLNLREQQITQYKMQELERQKRLEERGLYTPDYRVWNLLDEEDALKNFCGKEYHDELIRAYAKHHLR